MSLTACSEIGWKLALGGSFFDSHDPRIKGLRRLSFEVNPKFLSQHELRVSFLKVFIKLCHNGRVVVGIFCWNFGENVTLGQEDEI